MTTIVEYKLKKGETMGGALWSSGIYRKQDLRSFKDTAEGKPAAVYTLYDSAYLVNGRCANCKGSATDHQPACPGHRMKRIVNITHEICSICKEHWVQPDKKICYLCIDGVDQCSCYTPDYCQEQDKHDDAYYAKKRQEWKAKLEALGLKVDY